MLTSATLPPFEQVVERHGLDVWRFAVSQVGRDRADDVFQETMLAALAGYPALRDAGAVRSWLLRIAARKAVDEFRAAARAPVPVADPDGAGLVAAPEPADEELWARVRSLPTKQRLAVALRFVLDLDYADIGDAMQTSPEAARRNVFEALRTLRQRFGPHAASPAAVLSGEGPRR
ncbi:MAG TPA: sigma-70 family RNA polymerase sigma factor [Pseudonocardiaceae bacterium]|jgi:RNA polymerase sigma factor (sigma-70 family)